MSSVPCRGSFVRSALVAPVRSGGVEMDRSSATVLAQPLVPTADWHPWRVAPRSGFEVRDPQGRVSLVQIDGARFVVGQEFRYTDAAVQSMMAERLVRGGMSPEEAEAAVDEARTFTPSDENPTDLASIPRYMRWFESSYGRHTLAAIIHDDLIVDTPNGGPLEDDTLSDRFFREMMRSAGVPWLKRWIMWAAVALRSRWAVGGLRRASVVLWLVLSAVGITSFVWAAVDSDPPVDRVAMVLVAGALPFAAAVLWGRQYAAGIIAAAVALWMLPAAVLAGIGYLLYLGFERVADLVGLD